MHRFVCLFFLLVFSLASTPEEIREIDDIEMFRMVREMLGINRHRRRTALAVVPIIVHPANQPDMISRKLLYYFFLEKVLLLMIAFLIYFVLVRIVWLTRIGLIR